MNHLISIAIAGIILPCLVACSSANDKEKKDNIVQIPTSQTVAKQSLPEQKGTKGKVTVVDFSAGWCMPCQQFKPQFAKAASQLKGKAVFITVDVDGEPALANEYNVEAVPTLIIFDKEGNVADRMSGYMDSEEVVEKVKAFL